MCSSPTSWKLHNEVTVAVSISAATILVQCICRHLTSFPLYCFYIWWSDRTTSTSCTWLTMQLQPQSPCCSHARPFLSLDLWHQWKDWAKKSFPCAARTEGSVGLCQKFFQSLVRTNFILPILGQIHFPTQLGNLPHYTVFWDAAVQQHVQTQWQVQVHLRLNSLLYWTSYTAAFNSVQSYYTEFMLCTEFHAECLTLYRMFYTAALASAENFLHCMHTCTEFLTLYSLL